MSRVAEDLVALALRGEGPLYEAMLDERTRLLAQPKAQDGPRTPPVLLCGGAAGRYALALAAVRAVQPMPPVTVVPGASPEVLGLALLMGERHLVVSLDRLAGGVAQGRDEHAVILKDSGIALAVTRALDITDEPQTAPAGGAILVKGIAPDGTLLLDMAAVVARIMERRHG